MSFTSNALYSKSLADNKKSKRYIDPLWIINKFVFMRAEALWSSQTVWNFFSQIRKWRWKTRISLHDASIPYQINTKKKVTLMTMDKYTLVERTCKWFKLIFDKRFSRCILLLFPGPPLLPGRPVLHRQPQSRVRKTIHDWGGYGADPGG